MTQENQKSFMLYYDYRKHLSILTDEERGKLLMALFDYGETKKEPELEGAALMAFSFIACQMDRDSEKYAKTVQKRREAGQKGGRPKANGSGEKAKKANGFSENQSEAKKPDTDTVTVTDTVTDTTTSPYIPQGGNEAPAADQTPYKAIVALYHEICKSYPKLKKISDNRKKAIAARWKEYGHDLDTFRELFEIAEASAFLKGKNPRNWAADFDWLMNGTNMAKVLEGKYNENQNGGHNHGEINGYSERPVRTQNTGNETTLSGFRMADD